MRWRCIIAVICAGVGAGCCAALDPFTAAKPGATPPPSTPNFSLPANSPQLSVARPYALFLPDDDNRLSLRDTPTPSEAADWYRYWTFDLPSKPRSESRLNWVKRISGEVEALRTSGGTRGSIISVGSPEAVLSAPRTGDYLGITLKPRVTGNPVINRYGTGFLLRLASDVCERIPVPTLDLSDVRPGEAAWVQWWLDDAVRNGIAGLALRTPEDKGITDAAKKHVESLRGPTIYLPPLSEVAILVPLEALEKQPSGWDGVFRLYAGLRASGVWPGFVADEAVAAGTASLARYKIIIVARGHQTDSTAYRSAVDAARRGAAVLLFAEGNVTGKSGRIIARNYDGKPAIARQDTGYGYLLRASVNPWSMDGAWRGFWQGIMKEAGVPSRPWLESVNAANVGIITGKYTRPR